MNIGQNGQNNNVRASAYVSPYQNGRYVSPYQNGQYVSTYQSRGPANNFTSRRQRQTEETKYILMRSTGRYKILKYWHILLIMICMTITLVISIKVNDEHSKISKSQQDLKEMCNDPEKKCFIIENEAQYGGLVYFVFSIFLFIVYMTASVPKQYFIKYKYAIKIYFDLIPFMATYDIVTVNLLKKEIDEQDCECDNDTAFVFMVAMIWIFLASMVLLLINMCFKRCFCRTMKCSFSFYFACLCLNVLALGLNTKHHTTGEILTLGIVFSALGVNTTTLMLCSKYEDEEEGNQPNNVESTNVLLEIPTISSQDNMQQNQISLGGPMQNSNQPQNSASVNVDGSTYQGIGKRGEINSSNTNQMQTAQAHVVSNQSVLHTQMQNNVQQESTYQHANNVDEDVERKYFPGSQTQQNEGIRQDIQIEIPLSASVGNNEFTHLQVRKMNNEKISSNNDYAKPPPYDDDNDDHDNDDHDNDDHDNDDYDNHDNDNDDHDNDDHDNDADEKIPTEERDDFIEYPETFSKEVALINETAIRNYSLYLRKSLMMKHALKQYTQEWIRLRNEEMKVFVNSQREKQNSKLQTRFNVDEARVGIVGRIKKGKFSVDGQMRTDTYHVRGQYRGRKFLTNVDLSSSIGIGLGTTYRIGKTNFYISGKLNFAASGFSLTYVSKTKGHVTVGLSVSCALLPILELGFGRNIDINLGKLFKKQLQVNLHTMNALPVGFGGKWENIPKKQQQEFIDNPLVQEKVLKYRKEMEDLQKLNIAVHELYDIFDILATQALVKSISKTNSDKVSTDDEDADIYITDEVSNQMIGQHIIKEFQSKTVPFSEDELLPPVNYQDLTDFRRYRTDTSSQEYLRNQDRIDYLRNRPVVHSNGDDDDIFSGIGTEIWEYIKVAGGAGIAGGPAGVTAAIALKGLKDMFAFFFDELGDTFEADTLKAISDVIENPLKPIFEPILEMDVIKNNELFTTVVKKLQIIAENIGPQNAAINVLNKALSTKVATHVIEEDVRNAIVDVGVKKFLPEIIPEDIKKKFADNDIDLEKLVKDVISNPEKASKIVAETAKTSLYARLDQAKEKLFEIYNYEKALLIKDLEKQYPELTNVLKKVKNATVLVDLASGKIGKDDIVNGLLEYEADHYKDVKDVLLAKAQFSLNKKLNVSVEKLELVNHVLDNAEIQNIMKQKKLVASDLTLLSESFLKDIKDGNLNEQEISHMVIEEIESAKAPIAKRSPIEVEHEIPFDIKEQIMPARRAPVNVNEQIMPARRALVDHSVREIHFEMPEFEQELNNRFPIDDMFDQSWDDIA